MAGMRRERMDDVKKREGTEKSLPLYNETLGSPLFTAHTHDRHMWPME